MNTNSALHSVSVRVAGLRVSLDHHRLEAVLALELDDLAVGLHLRPVVALELVDQVARHRLAEVAAADQQPAAGGPDAT